MNKKKRLKIKIFLGKLNKIFFRTVETFEGFGRKVRQSFVEGWNGYHSISLINISLKGKYVISVISFTS